MRKLKAKSGAGRRKRASDRGLRVAVLADERYAVSREFLVGFYGYVRPERDWLILQAGTNRGELEAVFGWNPDIIVAPSTRYFIEELDATGTPSLYYLGAADASGRIWFHPDEEGVGAAAARHLLSCGYRHAACVFDKRHHGAMRRRDGFIREAGAAGLETLTFTEPIGVDLPRDARTFTSEDPLLQDWLKSLPPSTGIYAWTDSAALWVAETCFRMGIEVPGQIGVVGTDNQPSICLRAWPGLDSVMLPYHEIGTAVAMWIDEWMRGTAPPAPGPFAVAGVYRRKSTLLQSAGSETLKPFYGALQNSALEELSVPSLVRASGWSRRTLERRLREQTGNSILGLIERRRLEEAEFLLANTDRTVADITSACGFATTRSLELLFKKYHDTTPAAYAKSRRND